MKVSDFSKNTLCTWATHVPASSVKGTIRSGRMISLGAFLFVPIHSNPFMKNFQ